MNKFNSWEEFFASLTGAPETDYVSTSTKIVNDNGKVSGSASMDINGDKKSFEFRDGAFVPVVKKTEKQIEGEKLFKELKGDRVCPNLDASKPTELPCDDRAALKKAILDRCPALHEIDVDRVLDLIDAVDDSAVKIGVDVEPEVDDPAVDPAVPAEPETNDDAICLQEENDGLYSLVSYVRDDEGNKVSIAEAQEIQMNTCNEFGDEIPGVTLRQLLRVCRDYADKCEFNKTWEILNDLLADDPDDCLD